MVACFCLFQWPLTEKRNHHVWNLLIASSFLSSTIASPLPIVRNQLVCTARHHRRGGWLAAPLVPSQEPYILEKESLVNSVDLGSGKDETGSTFSPRGRIHDPGPSQWEPQTPRLGLGSGAWNEWDSWRFGCDCWAGTGVFASFA